MKLSIFTPTHNPRFLQEAWDSIKGQSFDEWVILHNNGSQAVSFGDARVQQYHAAPCPPFVGALKAQACAKATGDILLELDHDDLLLPGCVEKVRAAFVDHPEAGMVYSNALRCRLNAAGGYEPAPPFGGAFGWQTRPGTFSITQGGSGELPETLAFPPDPASVSRIWYAPDHVRAFRRSVYEAVGGYNPSYRVLDDQDLMARMYAAAEFVHLDEALYLYRVHGENAWLKHNDEIQANVMRLYESYIESIVLAWARRRGLLALDLGGRFNLRDGFQSVDLKDATHCCDLNGPWPFADNSVGAIRAQDIFEHLPDKLHTMREVYRVLAPGGWLFAGVPSTDGRGAFQDPTHRSFWCENDWDYYTTADYARFIDTPVRFQAVLKKTTPKDRRGVCWTMAHLVSLKDGYRPPGPIEI